MIFFIKGIIRRVRYAMFNTHHKDVKRYVSLFPKQDFQVIRKGNTYKITFDNSMGYYKENYEPTFSYSYWSNHWTVKVENIEIKTLINPCCELLCEWRGYTLKKSAAPGDVVIDAGGATGFISMMFAKKVRETGLVLALEPDHRLFEILKYNLKINDIQHVIPIQKGLYFEEGYFEFDPITLSLKLSGQTAGKKIIPTTTIQSLIKEYAINVSRISIIKLDIEGAEIDVSNDLGVLIRENPKVMAVIASYHAYKNTTTGKAIKELFETKYPELYCKEDFSIHPTTYIANGI